jgi:hypothetical protein
MPNTSREKPIAKEKSASQQRYKRPMLLAADVLLVLAMAGTIAHVVLDHRTTAQKEANICIVPGPNHEVTLQNDSFSQKQLTVHMCDSITIINKDDALYNLNFGAHDDHIAYPGFTSQIQAKDEAIQIDALQKGTFELHDHIRDNAKLTLTVEPKI